MPVEALRSSVVVAAYTPCLFLHCDAMLQTKPSSCRIAVMLEAYQNEQQQPSVA
jgi:hypothetical protein